MYTTHSICLAADAAEKEEKEVLRLCRYLEKDFFFFFLVWLSVLQRERRDFSLLVETTSAAATQGTVRAPLLTYLLRFVLL
jgi:hypothetical protein